MHTSKPSSPCWHFHPVDPRELFIRLCSDLDVLPDGVKPDGAFDLTAEQLVNLPFPSTKGEKFRERYLLREVLRKYPGFDLGIDTKQAALTTFLKGEEQNSGVSDRLHTLSVGSLPARRILYAASKKISKVLGRFSWDKFWKGWRFGPGATVTLASQDAVVYRKLRGRPAVTRSCLKFAKHLVKLNPVGFAGIECDAEGNPLFEIVEYDRYQSVPKNAKTDRSIGIPPDMNVACQLALGRELRRLMYRSGINLNDQSINQRWAQFGSENGTVATVDLANASGSITIPLVWHLFGSLPDSCQDRTWLWVMDALRTEYTLIDESTLHRNELFSAMGNGFTFELESLIFWALAHAVCDELGLPPKRTVSVYGDDIVLPVEAVSLLTEVFAFVGFQLNADKSFSTPAGDCFRESCGSHYLDGVDVSPFYVDSCLDNPGAIILLANNLHRWANHPGWRDGRVYGTWAWVLSHLEPAFMRCQIPMGSEDDGVILSEDEAHLKLLKSRHYPIGFKGYEVETASWGPRTQLVPDEERYLEWLYHREVGAFKPPISRSYSKGMERLRLAFSPRARGHGEIPSHWHEGDWFRSNAVPKRSGRKVSLLRGRRRVVSWAQLGPWVDDSSFIETGRDQLRTLIAAHRSAHRSWRSAPITRKGSLD